MLPAMHSSLHLARKYKQSKKLARSFAHYLVHWQLSKLASVSTVGCCKLEEILEVFDELTLNLEMDPTRTEDLLATYQQAVEVLPKNENIDFRFAKTLSKEGRNFKALELLTNNQGLKCQELINSIKCVCLDRWHFKMLNDLARNSAYCQALSNDVISKSHIVLDIGSGCGILSLFAAKANPKKVIACEVSPELANISNEVFKNNQVQLGHSTIPIELHNELSTNLKLDEKADVLVTETFDAGLFGEHVLEILDHAHKHLLQENNLVIPWKAKVYAAFGYCLIDTVIQTSNYGELDLSELNVMSKELAKEPYDCQKLKSSNVFSEAKEIFEIKFNSKEDVSRYLREKNAFSLSLKSSSERINCVITWFELFLNETGTIKLSTNPHQNEECCWDQAVFPLVEPFMVKTNDEIEVDFEVSSGHLKLTSVNKKSPTILINDNNLILIPSLWLSRVNHFKPFSEEMLNQFEDTKTIFDMSNIPMISLQILKKFSESTLTMYVDHTDIKSMEDTKVKVDFVTELAQKNDIQHSRISGISQILSDGEKYELLIFDPVDSSGRLSDTSIKSFNKIRESYTPNVVLPKKLNLNVALIESEELISHHKLVSNESVMNFKVAEFINDLSVDHVQNINLKDLKFRFLSDKATIHTFDFNNDSVRNFKTEFELEMESNEGKSERIIHAIIYWFDLFYQDDPNAGMSTINDDLSHCFEASAFLLPNPKKIDNTEDCLTCELIVEDGFIHISLVS